MAARPFQQKKTRALFLIFVFASSIWQIENFSRSSKTDQNLTFKAESVPTRSNATSSNGFTVLQRLRNNPKLSLSAKQHAKYFSQKQSAEAWIRDRVSTKATIVKQSCDTRTSYAIGLNDEYAFRHIYKNGGTTVQSQAGAKKIHIKFDDIDRNKKLLATVRDPIDHFLSGWAECGSRLNKFCQSYFLRSFQSYDEKIMYWLSSFRKSECWCKTHSLPQSSFLLVRDNDGQVIFDPSIDTLGHMKELPELLDFVGFPYKQSIPNGRNASLNKRKRKFPRNKSLLSESTILELCKFLALDYYMFDFEPPEVCRNGLNTGLFLSNMKITHIANIQLPPTSNNTIATSKETST